MSLIMLTYRSPALLPPNVICQLYAQRILMYLPLIAGLAHPRRRNEQLFLGTQGMDNFTNLKEESVE